MHRTALLASFGLACGGGGAQVQLAQLIATHTVALGHLDACAGSSTRYNVGTESFQTSCRQPSIVTGLSVENADPSVVTVEGVGGSSFAVRPTAQGRARLAVRAQLDPGGGFGENVSLDAVDAMSATSACDQHALAFDWHCAPSEPALFAGLSFDVTVNALKAADGRALSGRVELAFSGPVKPTPLDLGGAVTIDTNGGGTVTVRAKDTALDAVVPPISVTVVAADALTGMTLVRDGAVVTDASFSDTDDSSRWVERVLPMLQAGGVQVLPPLDTVKLTALTPDIATADCGSGRYCELFLIDRGTARFGYTVGGKSFEATVNVTQAP